MGGPFCMPKLSAGVLCAADPLKNLPPPFWKRLFAVRRCLCTPLCTLKPFSVRRGGGENAINRWFYWSERRDLMVGQFAIEFTQLAKFWKIVVVTKRMGSEKLVPMKEFYLVAVGDNPQEASKALHDRVGLDDAELRVIGEVPANVAEYFDVQPGEILCVMAVT
jgi:hypothetical protein